VKTRWTQSIQKFRLVKCRECGRVFKCLGSNIDGCPCRKWTLTKENEVIVDSCRCPDCLFTFHTLCKFGGYVEEGYFYTVDMYCNNCNSNFTYYGNKIIPRSRCPICGSRDTRIVMIQVEKRDGTWTTRL